MWPLLVRSRKPTWWTAAAQFQTSFFGMHRVCRTTLPHLRACLHSHLLTGPVAGPGERFHQGLRSASISTFEEAFQMAPPRSGVRLNVSSLAIALLK